MGTKLSLLEKSGKGRLGWQTPKPTSTEGSTPAPEVQRPQARCPQTLNYQKASEHTEVYPRDTN